jgi:cell division protein FtsB
MAHLSTHTADGFHGGLSFPGKQRSPFATRRRVLLLAMLLFLLAIAVFTNYGPIRSYRDARARLQAATTHVASLKAQKDQLQAQLAKLGENGYVESLAREQLTYARPGEEVFILTDDAQGAAAAGTSDTTEGGAAGEPAGAAHPGFFERLLTAIAKLF